MYCQSVCHIDCDKELSGNVFSEVERSRYWKYTRRRGQAFCKMAVRNQLSDYELAEFFQSLQDLLVLSFDSDLSFDSAEFTSGHLGGFERTLSVLHRITTIKTGLHGLPT